MTQERHLVAVEYTTFSPVSREPQGGRFEREQFFDEWSIGHMFGYFNSEEIFVHYTAEELWAIMELDGTVIASAKSVEDHTSWIDVTFKPVWEDNDVGANTVSMD